MTNKTSCHKFQQNSWGCRRSSRQRQKGPRKVSAAAPTAHSGQPLCQAESPELLGTPRPGKELLDISDGTIMAGFKMAPFIKLRVVYVGRKYGLGIYLD